MTSTVAERNIFVQSDSGDWYSIPPNMEDEFISIKELAINAEVGSDEWNDANSELETTFGSYRKD